jgi:hypothetical protein
MNITTITSLYIAGSLLTPVSVQAVELTEDFDVKGKPASSSKVKWSYRDELLPVRDWDSICPGDGFAYIKIDAIKANNKKKKWPFQTIAFSSVAPGHRIEMRAKNTVIKGVASFILRILKLVTKSMKLTLKWSVMMRKQSPTTTPLIKLDGQMHASIRGLMPTPKR